MSAAHLEVTRWGHGEEGARGTVYRGDPRVVRTQRHILEHARRLLAEQGPDGVAFSRLATRAQVSRQTLYRYWPSPAALVADLLRRRVNSPLPRASDLPTALTQYLRGIRDNLRDPANAAAWGMLMSLAAHSSIAADALVDLINSRLASINAGLAGLGRVLSRDDFARLIGPVIHGHYIERDITDGLIEDIVASFCRNR